MPRQKRKYLGLNCTETQHRKYMKVVRWLEQDTLSEKSASGAIKKILDACLEAQAAGIRAKDFLSVGGRQ